MIRPIVAVVLCVATRLAHADPPAREVTKLLEQITSQQVSLDDAVKLPRFAITNDDVSDPPVSWGSLRYPTGLPQVSKAKQPVVGLATDGSAAWIGSELTLVTLCATHPDDDTGDLDHYAPDFCKKGDPAAWLHGGALFERVGDRWQPLAWHLSGRQPGGNDEGGRKTSIDRQIEKGAEDPASIFEATIGDPAAFAKTISERGDVAMFGSEQAEKFVGGAKVRATLTRWNLSFKVSDGVRAGTTGSKTVAWVAANLEATSRARPKAPVKSYRVLVLYERKADLWQAVQLSFSAMPPAFTRAPR